MIHRNLLCSVIARRRPERRVYFPQSKDERRSNPRVVEEIASMASIRPKNTGYSTIHAMTD
ncbi:MAG: hypothetical protein HY867_10765 [Chloroflexi bacterium]|nr:hypothetical protein [Chloroflexota bacterium]